MEFNDNGISGKEEREAGWGVCVWGGGGGGRMTRANATTTLTCLLVFADWLI